MKALHSTSKFLDLAPARWIWWPSQRTLSNTFVLFRREVQVRKPLVSATGWISADSRYLLSVNGARVQWGPAPCDPRHLDADPLDLTAHLRPGRNVLGAQVLFYGHGDGTWPAGKPGLLVKLALEYHDGTREELITDRRWRTALDRAHPPGMYKRWYLRALQEVFDAQRFPKDWDTPSFKTTGAWLPALELQGRADKPAVAAAYTDYLCDTQLPDGAACELRPREVPLLRETFVPAKLAGSGRVRWRREPEDWFEFRTPDSFELDRKLVVASCGNGVWKLPSTAAQQGVYALFELPEEMIGFPCFTIDAAAGTVVDLMWHEAHDPRSRPWLDSQFHTWARYTCREGENRFANYDYEGLRWLQVHVRNARRPVLLRGVGVNRRLYPWPYRPHVRCGEPALQKLFEACFNTLENLAQGSLHSDAARERQQYSADGSRPLLPMRAFYGDTALSRRFLRTLAEGQTHEGYFLDCWPAYDRLNRIGQRLLGTTS